MELGRAGEFFAFREVLPPFDEFAEAALKGNLGFEAEAFLRFGYIREPAPNGSGFAGRTKFRWEIYAHDFPERLREFLEAGFFAASNVDDVIGNARIGGDDIRAGDVIDVNEIHRLAAIAEDEAGLAFGEAFHPADHHFGVNAIGIHARTVNIEVTESDVVQAIHFIEAAEHAFAVKLDRAIHGAVAVAVVVFGGGKFFGLAIDGGGGSVDDALHFGGDGGFEDVEGAGREDVVSEAGIFGALRDSDRGFVEDDVDAVHDVADVLSVPDVAFDEGDFAGSAGGVEVLHAAAGEVIEDDDFFEAVGDELVGDVGTDQAGAAGDESTLVFDHSKNRCAPGEIATIRALEKVSEVGLFRRENASRNATVFINNRASIRRAVIEDSGFRAVYNLRASGGTGPGRRRRLSKEGRRE